MLYLLMMMVMAHFLLAGVWLGSILEYRSEQRPVQTRQHAWLGFNLVFGIYFLVAIVVAASGVSA